MQDLSLDEAASPSPILSFLDFPAEVRELIYSYLFSSCQLSIQSSHPTSPHCGFSICSCEFPWHITNTCRQLRREATPYLLASAKLEVYSSLQLAAKLPNFWLASIPHAVILDAKSFSTFPIRLERFKSLQTLELRNITIWCQFHEESFLETDEANKSMHVLAMYNLRRISPRLLDLCNNSSRRFNILLCCQFVGSSQRQETIVRKDLIYPRSASELLTFFLLACDCRC